MKNYNMLIVWLNTPEIPPGLVNCFYKIIQHLSV